nr:class I tRNA ligase family protein [Rhizobium leguminosarum]
MIGVRRFLERAWRIVCDESDGLSPVVLEVAPSPQLLRLRHQTVKAVTADIEAIRFNTAVSPADGTGQRTDVGSSASARRVETFVLLLAPFAPHIAEELWSKLGHGETLTWVSWPTFDPAMIEMETRDYVVQINGKVRHRFEAAADLGEALLAAARSEPSVMALLDGKTVVKEVLVPGRLVNFVVDDL